MTDKEFARYAAQSAIFGPFGLASQWYETEQRVLEKWQERVDRLWEAGWRSNSDYRSRDALKKCPPFPPVLPGKFGWSCRLQILCPWCWARRVNQIAPRIRRGFKTRLEATVREPILVTSPYAEAVPQYPLHMLERDRRIDIRSIDPDNILKTLQRLSRERDWSLRRLKMKGALVAMSVSPVSGGWRVHSRQLYAVPAHTSIPSSLLPSPYDDTLFRRYEQLSLHQLIDAIGRTFQYPRYLLNGPIQPVLDYLRFRQSGRLRMTITTGIFHSNHAVNKNHDKDSSPDPPQRICEAPELRTLFERDAEAETSGGLSVAPPADTEPDV